MKLISEYFTHSTHWCNNSKDRMNLKIEYVYVYATNTWSIKSKL